MAPSALASRSLWVRALFVAALLGSAYPLFQARAEDQTLLLDLGSRADWVRALRLEWAATDNPDLHGVVERNFDRSPCPTPNARPCLVAEHLSVPNGSYTLVTVLSYELEPKMEASAKGSVREAETATHEHVMLSGGSTKVFLSKDR